MKRHHVIDNSYLDDHWGTLALDSSDVVASSCSTPDLAIECGRAPYTSGVSLEHGKAGAIRTVDISDDVTVDHELTADTTGWTWL